MAEDPFQRFEKLHTFFSTPERMMEPLPNYLSGLGISPGTFAGGMLTLPQQMREFLELHEYDSPAFEAKIRKFEVSLSGLSLNHRANDWRDVISKNSADMAEVNEMIGLLKKHGRVETGSPLFSDLPAVLEYLRVLRAEVSGSDLDPDSKKWLLDAIDSLTKALSEYWYSGPENLKGLVLATALRLDGLTDSDKKNSIFRRFAFVVRDLAVNLLATGIWTFAAPQLSWIPPSPPELSRCFVQHVYELSAPPEMKELNPGPQLDNSIQSTNSGGALSD
jgi:hypothetical protein